MDSQGINVSFNSLGTEIYAEIICRTACEKKRAYADLLDIKKEYSTLKKVFDRFDPISELSQLNNNLGQWTLVSPELIHCLRNSLRYHELTDGYFDPRILDYLESIGYRKDFAFSSQFERNYRGSSKHNNRKLSEDIYLDDNKTLIKERVDLGGLAKGYITDVASAFLKKRGWKNFLIDSGGDMFAFGKAAHGNAWRIEIEGLSMDHTSLGISDRGIATSGVTRKHWRIDKKNYHHLINPYQKNNFLFALASVTVIAESAELADIWAKSLFLMGRKAGLKLANNNNLAALFLEKQGSVFYSKAIKEYLLP